MAASVNVTRYVVLHQYENFNGISCKIFFVLALTHIHKYQLKVLPLKGNIYWQNKNQEKQSFTNVPSK